MLMMPDTHTVATSARFLNARSAATPRAREACCERGWVFFQARMTAHLAGGIASAAPEVARNQRECPTELGIERMKIGRVRSSRLLI